jgi:hypothetical protein
LAFDPSSPDPNLYRIETPATDNNGDVETNVASEEIKVAGVHLTFLSAIINNRLCVINNV